MKHLASVDALELHFLRDLQVQCLIGLFSQTCTLRFRYASLELALRTDLRGSFRICLSELSHGILLLDLQDIEIFEI